MPLWWQSVRSLVESVPCSMSREPGTCGMQIHFLICLATDASKCSW